jgi:hypothetical protein
MNLRDIGSETIVNDTDEACRTSEISVALIIIIVFGNTTIIEAPFLGSGCGRGRWT